MSASLIGRMRSSAFRLSTITVSRSLASTRFSSESAPGPSIMGSEDEVEQSLGRPCPTAGPSGHANSPHPSSREGHYSTAWWSSSFLLSLERRPITPSLGQKRTWRRFHPMSALPPKADIVECGRHVRFLPKADIGPKSLIDEDYVPAPGMKQRICVVP